MSWYSSGRRSVEIGCSATQCFLCDRLGGFIANVGTVGLNEALRREGLAGFIGRPIREVLAALLDRLGGPSSTIDEVDARAAMARLQDQLFAEAADVQAVEDLLTKAAENLGSLVERYFGFYLYELFCRVFFERLTRLVGDATATSFLGQIKSYIIAALTNRLGTGAVFHWYTASLRTLDDILQAGHLLSVNPAMISAERGRAVVRQIPRERLLTETDGPHVLVNETPAMPRGGIRRPGVGKLTG